VDRNRGEPAIAGLHPDMGTFLADDRKTASLKECERGLFLVLPEASGTRQDLYLAESHKCIQLIRR
jgi:hypothetical protein